VVASWAEENSIAVTEQDLENEINIIRANYPDDIAFRNSFASEDISFHQWKETLRRTLLEKKIIKKLAENISQPTDAEVKESYENHKEEYKRGEQIYLRQILLNKENSAEELRSRLVKGTSFEEMAKQYSMAPEAANGGLVGWVEKKMLDVFDKAFKLPLNSVSKIFESPYGYHIFKVEKHRDAGYMSLEDVRPRIRNALLKDREQALYSAWLDQQIRRVKIFRDDNLINAIGVETRSD
jgi:peptidyl-prolyl cis-trans isomerase C